jgi:hypothetical protein
MFDSDVRAAAAAPCPADVDDAELIELIQAWQRLAAWAAAGQLAAIGELAHRRPRSLLAGPGGPVDAGDPAVPQVSEFAVDEVATALRLSRPAAGARLHLAVELTRLPATTAALADGLIDLPKARAVVDAVTVLDPPHAAAVERQVLPRAGTQTVGQLRAALAHAVLAADPAAAETRHQRAVASRQVTLRPTRDGMAELSALLPADAAVAVYQRIDDLARHTAADGTRSRDARSRDARRADALVAAVLGATAGPAAAPAVAATVHITMPADTALGLDTAPGELTGYGPVPASLARRLGAHGPWRKVTISPTTGTVIDVGRTAYSPSAALADLVGARDRTCRFPGCRQPAGRCDLDHVLPWPAGPTTAANLAALCRHHHRLKHRTSWTVRAGADAELEWTSPAGHVYRTCPPP